MTREETSRLDKLIEDVGYIKGKIELIPDLAKRVTNLENQNAAQEEREDTRRSEWLKRDKIYVRAFAAIGSLGAVTSAAAILITAFGGK